MAKSSRGPSSGRRRTADQREQASAPAGGDVNPAAPSGQAMHSAGAGPANAPRFRIFIVDCGWNSPARRVLLDNFSLIRELQQDDPIYVLSREKSIELARRYGSRIGRDPIIAVHDMAALERDGTAGFHGFRLSLGLLRTSHQALLGLQSFVRFLVTHRRSPDLEADIRANLRREGLMGAIEIMMHHESRDLLSDV
jgi:hypothetical protein